MSDHEAYPFLRTLEENTADILEELDNLLYNEAAANVSFFEAWPEKDIYEGDWDVYGLYSFGKKLKKNCERCPKTTAIVESIPGMTTAGFSGLAPGTHIKPHVGYSGDVLRCHLGLVVPKHFVEYNKRPKHSLAAGNCWLRVGNHVYQWEVGKAFVFDDTIEHEALNAGDRTRFVLLIDFRKNP